MSIRINRKISRPALCCLLMLSCSACASGQTATDQEEVETQVVSPNPAVGTPISTLARTAAPTSTQIRTPTQDKPAVDATQTSLSNEGPWVVFSDRFGLWVINTDGTGLQEIITPLHRGRYFDFNFAVSPSGGYIAFGETLTSSGMSDWGEYPPFPFFFNIVHLPNPEPQVVTTLIESAQVEAITTMYPENAESDYEEGWFQLEQVKAAVTRPGSLAWSPQGDYLAFAAVLDGPSSDLYVMNTATNMIRRLTSGLT